jgi:hypothetical protein
MIRYSEDRFRLHMNSELVYSTVETPYRPRLTWIGHPPDLGISCQCDTLGIDHARVDSVAELVRRTREDKGLAGEEAGRPMRAFNCPSDVTQPTGTHASENGRSTSSA